MDRKILVAVTIAILAVLVIDVMTSMLRSEEAGMPAETGMEEGMPETSLPQP